MNLFEDYIAYDTETTGLNIFKGARPFLYAITYNPAIVSVEYSDTDYIEDYKGLRTLVTRNINTVRPILESPIAKAAHNMKFDQIMSHSRKLKLGGSTYCTIIAKHLIDENSRNNLDACSEMFLRKYGVGKEGTEIDNWFKERKIKKEYRRYDTLPDYLLLPYAAKDSLSVYLLWYELRQKIVQEGLQPLFEQEIELKDELIRSYLRGVPIDLEYTEMCKYAMQAELKQMEESIFRTVGYEFNVNSGRELADFLIDEGFSLPKTNKGNTKTDKKTIESINHPLIKEVLAYRRTSKMLSTYIENFLRLHVNGVLHCDLNQSGTVTGRFSCSDPNLQTIPKPKKDPRIGRCFTGREGYTTFSIDWKQMEYRVFLSDAQEVELIRRVNEEDADYHQLIMEQIPQYLTSRDMAKTYNFMVLYGGGPKKIAKTLGISEAEGYALKEAFFANLPNAKRFMSNAEYAVAARGYIKNRYGRRRHLRSGESYMAVNARIQGGCADYVKEKMIKTAKFIRPYGGFLTLQVHDDLHMEVPNDNRLILPQICDIMEDSMNTFGIKLGVDPCIYYPSWGQKVEVNRFTLQPKPKKQEVIDTMPDIEEELYDW